MEKYPTNRYVKGEYKRQDDITGFDYLRGELVKNWKGLLVHPDNLDEKPWDLEPRKLPAERQLRFE